MIKGLRKSLRPWSRKIASKFIKFRVDLLDGALFTIGFLGESVSIFAGEDQTQVVGENLMYGGMVAEFVKRIVFAIDGYLAEDDDDNSTRNSKNSVDLESEAQAGRERMRQIRDILGDDEFLRRLEDELVNKFEKEDPYIKWLQELENI